VKLSNIAGIVNGTLYGNDIEINRVGSLETEYDDAIIYIEKNKQLEAALLKKPAALVVPKGIAPSNLPYIVVNDPKLAFIKLLETFDPRRNDSPNPVIDKHSFIDEEAIIGNNVTIMPSSIVMNRANIHDNCIIYPNCVIEKDVKIGKNTIIHSGVIIKERCIIGTNCIIHSGTVIGSDGYGFYEKDGEILKIPQIGTVIIGNRVEIGANCCIDRATLDTTEIGNDCKFDNMVHIAHNVKIGERCYIVAQAGISGSVKIGNHVTILGQVGIADHVTIADETIILGQSGLYNNIKKSDILIGSPARPVKEQHKIQAALKYLPDLIKRVKRIEKELWNKKYDS